MKKPWKTVKLGDISDFEGGSQPPKATFMDQLQTGYIRLLQIRDFKSDHHAVFIPVASKNRTCKSDDIMIGRYGASVGQILRGKEGAYNVALIKAIPNKNIVYSEFFYFYLTSALFQDNLLSVADRSAQAGFSKSDIAEFDVPLPPLEEQDRIVVLLNKAFGGIDAAIANAEKNLANARELFDSALNSLFERKGSGWIEKSIAEITCKIGSGATPKGGYESYKPDGIPLIRSLNVHDRKFKYDSLAFLDDDQAKKLGNVIVTEGDLLLNITGASVARCCKVPDDTTPARVNQHVSIIRPIQSIILTAFLEYALTARRNKDTLLGVGEKGGSTRQAITKADIQQFQVAYPSLDAQEEIVCWLDALRRKTEHLEGIYQKKLDALTRLRHVLLQNAFTGELTAGTTEAVSKAAE